MIKLRRLINKPEKYDLHRIELGNPNVIPHEHQFMPTSPTHTHRSVALTLYFFIGSGVFFLTRLGHDYHWDRYYHVYYPALMEYFDVLSFHYSRKLQHIKQNLPPSLSVLVPDFKTMPISAKASQMVKEDPETLVQEETDFAEAFVAVFDAQKNRASTVDKKFEELTSALDSSLSKDNS